MDVVAYRHHRAGKEFAVLTEDVPPFDFKAEANDAQKTLQRKHDAVKVNSAGFEPEGFIQKGVILVDYSLPDDLEGYHATIRFCWVLDAEIGDIWFFVLLAFHVIPHLQSYHCKRCFVNYTGLRKNFNQAIHFCVLLTNLYYSP